MRAAIIHGVLLVVMLVYGYRTWTRDKAVKANLGTVVLWDKAEPELESIELTSEKKIVRLDRKPEGGGYWWGTETTIEKKQVPVKAPEPAAGSGSGSAAAGSGSAAAGSGSAAAGSGSAAAGSGSAAAPPVEMKTEETRKTLEFPLGDGGGKVITAYTAARALRDLGVLADEAKKNYKLTDAKTTLVIKFKGGQSRTFLVGGSVYGGSDRYVLEPSTGRGYVLAKDFVASLELGKSSLHLTDPRGFDQAKLEALTIEGQGELAGKQKVGVRVTTGVDTKQVKTWGDPATKKADAALANFIDTVNNLRPTEYSAKLAVSSLTPIMKVSYRDTAGAALGTLMLYKREKAGELPEGQELDPANPPKGVTEYYIVTEKTRVPALVRTDTAQRAEQDLPIVFGDKAPTPPAPAAGSGSGGPTMSPHDDTPREVPPAPSPHGAGDGHAH